MFEVLAVFYHIFYGVFEIATSHVYKIIIQAQNAETSNVSYASAQEVRARQKLKKILQIALI